jgi:hypothetical protein
MPDIKAPLREFICASCGEPMPHPDSVRCAYIRLAVEHFKGNLSRTSRAMGLHRRTLQRMLQKNPDRRVGKGQECRGDCVVCAREST